MQKGRLKMKNVYIIGGTMGVGKTTVSRLLMKKLPKSVFLDGDWCWDSDPFQVTDETKTMVMDNIRHMLSNFIRCSVYENVIFCWVMHQQEIIDDILRGLDTSGCRVICISLTTDKESLIRRLKYDIERGIRTADVMDRSVARLSMYNSLNTIKINTSDISAEETANRIAAL